MHTASASARKEALLSRHAALEAFDLFGTYVRTSGKIPRV